MPNARKHLEKEIMREVVHFSLYEIYVLTTNDSYLIVVIALKILKF